MSDGPTRAPIEARLADLRREFAAGRQMAVDLEQQRVNLEQSRPRIGGAIQLLEALLDGREAGNVDPAGQSGA